jgi:hypothetical protein
VRLEGVGLGDADHGVEGDAMVLLGRLEHVGGSVRQHDDLVLAL